MVPLIIGIVQLLKRYGFPAKYSSLAAVALGLIFGIFFTTADMKERIIIGLMLGLSASGLYSGGKNLMETENKDPK